jgi:hypothetical protein
LKISFILLLFLLSSCNSITFFEKDYPERCDRDIVFELPEVEYESDL